MTRVLILALLLATNTACNRTPAGPDRDDADVVILFIGNSLQQQIPDLVQAMADEEGLSVAVYGIGYPNFSLEDHWNTGVADEIREIEADFVVMQQGPSSLPDSRVHLVYWTQRLAPVIREAGGIPALYMVWPDNTRLFAFGAVEGSYAAAAEAVDGLLLPAGTTWRGVWNRDDGFPLYGPDGFHASYLGRLAAAITIYSGIFDVPPSAVPSLDDNVTSAHLQILHDAAGASIAKWNAPSDQARGGR